MVKGAVESLLIQSDECYLATQVLIELWVVAARPTKSNGLGWSVEKIRDEINQLTSVFPVMDEVTRILPAWLDLVTENAVMGKRAHDARIASLMLSSDVRHILTLNPKDFLGFSGVTVIRPQEIVGIFSK